MSRSQSHGQWHRVDQATAKKIRNWQRKWGAQSALPRHLREKLQQHHAREHHAESPINGRVTLQFANGAIVGQVPGQKIDRAFFGVGRLLSAVFLIVTNYVAVATILILLIVPVREFFQSSYMQYHPEFVLSLLFFFLTKTCPIYLVYIHPESLS